MAFYFLALPCILNRVREQSHVLRIDPQLMVLWGGCENFRSLVGGGWVHWEHAREGDARTLTPTLALFPSYHGVNSFAPSCAPTMMLCLATRPKGNRAQ